MYTPVEQHAAALCFDMPPVTRNAVRSVYTGLNLEQASDRLRLVHLLDDPEILIPASVLVHH
ncbi:hypothetical protein D3C80_2177330 [compost metagenome]